MDRLSEEDRAEVDRLRAKLHSTQSVLFAVKGRLGGYYVRQNELLTAIAETHAEHVAASERSDAGSRVAVLGYTFDPVAAAERMPMFEMLDQLNKDFAPLKKDRQDLALQVKRLSAVIQLIVDPKPMRRRRSAAAS